MDKHGITHTARIKTYSGGTSEVLCASVPIFREPGWEARSKRPRGRAEAEDHTSESEYVLEAVEKSIYALEREEELSRKRENGNYLKGAFYEQRKTSLCRKETCFCCKGKRTEA